MTDISRKTLLGAARKGRVPNAYIFSGISLKELLDEALLFASALNCEKKGETPCGECDACRKIAKRISPDLLVLSTSGKSIKIDDVRQITDFVKYGPLSSNWKMVIIEAADLMTEEAANSFLKTLEEPQDNVHFILTTTRENLMLKTIVSRCQKLLFSSEEPETDESSKELAQKLLNAPKMDIPSLLSFSDELSGLPELERSLNSALYFISKASVSGPVDSFIRTRKIFDAVRALGRRANKKLAMDNMVLSLKGGE